MTCDITLRLTLDSIKSRCCPLPLLKKRTGHEHATVLSDTTMLLKSSFILCLATLGLKGTVCGPLNVPFESNGQSLKLGVISIGDHQEVPLRKFSTSCNRGDKGLLRMTELHLEICDGKSWVRLLNEKVARNSSDNNAVIGTDCKEIKELGYSRGDGMYLLAPEGNHSNTFLAYCDMTSYGGGWTMCYTTDDYVKPRTEVTYNPQFPYGSDGYRSNCNNIPFQEIIFVDHQTGEKIFFKRMIQGQFPITAANNYGNQGGVYGLWHGVGANNYYKYQLLICDDPAYSGFLVSGYSYCYKRCLTRFQYDYWCSDSQSPYFRTASTKAAFKGVAFNTNGYRALGNRLMSVGLR